MDSENTFIDLFIDTYLQLKPGRIKKIIWRDMQYLWKHFLDSNKYSVIVSKQVLEQSLIQKLSEYYIPNMDSFQGISSEYLPNIQTFLTFWQQTISYEEDREHEYEVSEIGFLLHLFSLDLFSCKTPMNGCFHQQKVTLPGALGMRKGVKKWDEDTDMYMRINDKQLLDLLHYFFPRLEIEENKYICNIKCSLWDKQLDIESSLQGLKMELQTKYNVADSHVPFCMISIDDAYIFYCQFMMKLRNTNEQIVSQLYFEKYLFENLTDFLLLSKYISSEWIRM